MNFKAALFCLILIVAQISAAASLIEVPEHCLQKKIHPCAISSDRRTKVELTSGLVASSLVLETGAKLLIDEKEKLNLVTGEVGIIGLSTLEFRHGAVEILARGQVYLKRTDRWIQINVLDGRVEVRTANRKMEVLTSGWSQEIGPMDPLTSLVQFRVAKPFDFHPVVTRWLQIKGGNAAQVAADISQYKTLWIEAIETATAEYSGQVDRNIASDEARRKKDEAAKSLRETENRKLRELFRQKTL